MSTAGTKTEKPRHESVKDLVSRLSREIPRPGGSSPTSETPTAGDAPASTSNVKLRSVRQSYLDSVTSSAASTPPIGKKPTSSPSTSTDDKDATPTPAAMTTSVTEDPTPAIAKKVRGVGYPMPNEAVQLKSVNDGATRTSILFPTKPPPTLPTHSPPTIPSVDPTAEYVKADHPYEGKYVDELTFVKGDVIKIVTKEAEEEGYWVGMLNGKKGLFPNNFVSQHTPPVESSNVETTPSHTRQSPSTAIAPKPFSKPAMPNPAPFSMSTSMTNRSSSPAAVRMSNGVPKGDEPLKNLSASRAAGPKKRPPSTAFVQNQLAQSSENSAAVSRALSSTEEETKLTAAPASKPTPTPVMVKREAMQPKTVIQPKVIAQPPSSVTKSPAKTADPIITTSLSKTMPSSTVEHGSVPRSEFNAYKTKTDATISSLETTVRQLQARLAKLENK